MINIVEKSYGNILVIQRSDYKWGVLDNKGSEVVAFGVYDWIDSFDQGLARVKLGKSASYIKDNCNKWGIINMDGEVVLPVEYDNIWNFAGKNRFSTITTKNRINKEVYLHDLNPELPACGIKQANEEREYYDDYGSQ